MRLEYLPDGSPDCPLIRLFDFASAEAASLGAVVAGLATGQVERVAVHHLPGVTSVGGCELVFRLRGWDQAIVRVGSTASGLIEPFAVGARGYQWLAGVPGEASLLLSASGYW